MKLLRLACVLAFLSVPGGAAEAHAIVLESIPRADQTVSGGDVVIEIRFNSRIDVERSHLKLFKPDGGALVLPAMEAAAADVLKSKATGLTPGAYRLHWQTLSPDGHISQGDIRFDVSR
jgi:copper resistance protein C